MLELQAVQTKSDSKWHKICPFPVGFIYIAATSTSPSSTFGGTWTAVSGSRYLRLAAAFGTGGSNTIKIEHMPKHIHPIAILEGTQIQKTDGGLDWSFGSKNGGYYTSSYTADLGGYVAPAGGGKRFTLLIRMYTLGAGPRSGLHRNLQSKQDAELLDALGSAVS